MFTLSHSISFKNKDDSCGDYIVSLRYGVDGIIGGAADGTVNIFAKDEECRDRYRLIYTYQSHIEEFDYLENTDISEKIVCLEEIDTGGLYRRIISCNEKSIKVYQLKNRISSNYIINNNRETERDSNININNNNRDSINNTNNIINQSNTNIINQSNDNIINQSNYNNNIININQSNDNKYISKLQYTNNTAHLYTINSLCISSNFMLSSDYLSVKLWNLSNYKCLTLVDIKPIKYEELDYVITSSRFIDEYGTGSIMGYSTSHGEIVLNDMRVSLRSADVLRLRKKEKLSRFHDFLKSVSDFKYRDNTIVGRDLNSVTLYDIRKNNTHLHSFNIFVPTDGFMEHIFEENMVYERFKVDVQHNKIVTGTFNSEVVVFDSSTGNKQIINVNNTHNNTLKENHIHNNSKYNNRIKLVAIKNNNLVISKDNTLYFYNE